MTEFDLYAVRQVMGEDPTGDDTPGVVLAAVPYGEPDDGEDQPEGGGLVSVLVGEQVAYARSCDGVWEYRYQWFVAVPAVVVLALGIRIVSHHRSFFGALAALSVITILAAWSGLL